MFWAYTHRLMDRCMHACMRKQSYRPLLRIRPPQGPGKHLWPHSVHVHSYMLRHCSVRIPCKVGEPVLSAGILEPFLVFVLALLFWVPLTRTSAMELHSHKSLSIRDGPQKSGGREWPTATWRTFRRRWKAQNSTWTESETLSRRSCGDPAGNCAAEIQSGILAVHDVK